jgi:trimeric autotransporter adhesin
VYTADAQVKIGGSAAVAVNPNAVLELESADRGFLLPRLGLLSTTNHFPLTSFTAGILVYDTATVGDITPGLYYSDGIKWVKVSGGSTIVPTGGGWSLTGNAGTDPVQHFLGTLDSKDLVFKTNNIEQLRLTKDGWLGIGTNTPLAALQVKGQVIIDTLQAGNAATDSVLVADASGKVKAVSANSFSTSVSVKKTSITIIQSGYSNLTTPATISDPAKITLYRNGVMINFTVVGVNAILPEVPCNAGDEIKIVQTL